MRIEVVGLCICVMCLVAVLPFRRTGGHSTILLGASDVSAPYISAPGYSVTSSNTGATREKPFAVSRPSVAFSRHFERHHNGFPHVKTVANPRPTVTFGKSFENEARRTVKGGTEPVRVTKVDRPAIHLEMRGAEGSTISSKNSASAETIRHWANWKPQDAIRKFEDPCPSGSLCSLIKHLNSEHLGGVQSRGAEEWAPSSEAIKQARVQSIAKDTGREQDESLCDVCVEHHLADSGPARYLNGHTIAHQARVGACGPFCHPHATDHF